jgi:hypothetical protein
VGPADRPALTDLWLARWWPTTESMDRVTIKSDELEARIEELQTEALWRRAFWLVAGAGVVLALAVAAALYVAYWG